MNLKLFKTKKLFKKESTYQNPDFLWSLLLLMMAVMTVISFLIGLVYFLKVNDEVSLEGVSNTSQVEKVNQARMEGVLQQFHNRKAQSETILLMPAPVVDPSL